MNWALKEYSYKAGFIIKSIWYVTYKGRQISGPHLFKSEAEKEMQTLMS